MKKSLEFIELIKNHPTVIRYKKLEVLITNDLTLKTKLKDLKAVQKQMVNAEALGKKQAFLKFKKAYESQLEDIESTPLLSEYMALQGEINYMIQEVVGIIEDGINHDIEA